MGKTKGKKHSQAASALSPTGLQSVKQIEKELTPGDLAGIDTVIEKVCEFCLQVLNGDFHMTN